MFFNDKRRKLTARQFEQEVERLTEIVKGAVSPFENDSPAKQEERVRRAREDQDYFNATYLPHYFTQPGAEFHREMEEMIGEGIAQRRPVSVAAPRGHSKTTRVTFAHTLKEALYEENKFTIVISDTEQQARGMTVSVRVEAEHNPRIAHDFGEQRTFQWAAGDFVLKSGTRVMARGDGQGIRGLKHGPYRPDRVKIDDIESDESVRNPDRIKQTLAWIMEAVVPSLDPMTGVLFIVGTLLAKKSVLAQCLSNPVFIARIYRAVEEPVWDEELKEFGAGTPLWPERFSLEQLSRTRNLVGSVSFNKEYQNDPRNDEGLFREEWFKRFKWDNLPNVPLYHYAGRDPSLKNGQSNDFKGHVSVAHGGAKIYVRYASIKRISIDQMVKEDFVLVRRFGILQIGLETVSWQDLLRRDYAREGEVQKFFLPIVPIPRTGKDAVAKEDEMRIGGLSPLVENGILVFAEGPPAEVGDMEVLIEQLLYFPSSSVHDDGPDALEIAVHLAQRRVGGKPSYERVGQRAASFGAGAW